MMLRRWYQPLVKGEYKTPPLPARREGDKCLLLLGALVVKRGSPAEQVANGEEQQAAKTQYGV